MKHFVFTLAVAALVIGVPAYAHHSFAAYYFESQSTSIQGEIVEFAYQSPHAWVHLSVKEEDGQVRKYSAEWANPNRLNQQNITKETLQPGDVVIITGSPGRKPEERKMHLKGIQRPADGWNWPAPRSARNGRR